MSISRNVQGQKCRPHEKNYEKKDEHDGPVGMHDTNAHHQPKYIDTNIGTTTELHQGITSRMAETPVPLSGSSGGEGS